LLHVISGCGWCMLTTKGTQGHCELNHGWSKISIKRNAGVDMKMALKLYYIGIEGLFSG